MNKITTISTIRHGQTDYNSENRYAGLIDVPLNKKGIEDAKNAALKLCNHKLDVVVTSKLTRAIHTSHLLAAGRNIQVIENKLCNERNYGRMQGLTFTEVEEVRPQILYVKLNNDFHSLNPPEGETFPALRRRAKSFSRFIFENYTGCNVLVVSSSAFMQQLHGIFRNTNWKESLRDEIHNLDFTTFTFKGNRLIGENAITLNRSEES